MLEERRTSRARNSCSWLASGNSQRFASRPLPFQTPTNPPLLTTEFTFDTERAGRRLRRSHLASRSWEYAFVLSGGVPRMTCGSEVTPHFVTLSAHTYCRGIGFIALILHGLLRSRCNRLILRIFRQIAGAPNDRLSVNNEYQPI